MDRRIRELLKPEVLNTVSGLELVARIVVEGFMSGTNKSQTIGIGGEFSQYRNYEIGDDLRQLDWKMYARSERYFVKQAEVETNITVKFFVDASNSMAYEEERLTKLQFARAMTAALAYLARKQGDTFGLVTVNDRQTLAVHPRFEQQQFMRFLHALVETKAEGQWKKRETEHLFDHRGKEMIIFISDMYDHEGDVLQFASRLKTTRNEVIVFHLLGARERNLGWDGAFTFRDLETDAVVKVDTRMKKQVYQSQLEEWVAGVRTALFEKMIHYYTVSMGDPLEETLSNFLKARKKLRA